MMRLVMGVMHVVQAFVIRLGAAFLAVTNAMFLATHSDAMQWTQKSCWVLDMEGVGKMFSHLLHRTGISASLQALRIGLGGSTI